MPVPAAHLPTDETMDLLGDLLGGVSLIELLLAFGLVIGGAALQGSTGLGIGLVAAPVLAIIDPVFVPGPLLVLGTAIGTLAAWRERHALDRKLITYALAGRFPAALLATVTMSLVPASSFALVFAALVLAAVGISMAGWRVEATPRNVCLAGAAAGYIGTITSIGGPPMAIVYQHAAGPVVRATLSTFFMVGAFVSILLLAAFGHFGLRELALGMALLPAMLVGFLMSGRMLAFVDGGRLRGILLSVSAASAVVLVLRQVL